jgi:hypothetical protein
LPTCPRATGRRAGGPGAGGPGFDFPVINFIIPSATSFLELDLSFVF